MAYSDIEFANKVDWEGGLWEALTGYGLSSRDLEDQGGELAVALFALESIIESEDFKNRLQRVEDALPEPGDED